MTPSELTLGRLLAVVVSWNRPQLLTRTLESLFAQLEGVGAEVLLVDNGSAQETRDVILGENRLSRRLLLDANVGINAALERVLPDDVGGSYEAVLISDADMEYRQPFATLLPVLEAVPGLGAVSLQHSPEHPILGDFEFSGHRWLKKHVERGCALLFNARRFQQLRPLPVEKMLDFDWWVMRDAPRSLRAQGEFVAVSPGAAVHLGWRAGDSTWQSIETPEFEEHRI